MISLKNIFWGVGVDQIKRDLNGKGLKDDTKDKSLPVCWKGSKPFKSVSDVKSYFKPFLLNFPKKVQLQIPPEAYLIITVSIIPNLR